jgi:PIN domain nuclease of toxin-antitoxin system
LRLLLDTHVYIWAIMDVERLSPTARFMMANEENELCLSVASLWEATIKISKGAMVVPGNHIDFLLDGIVTHHVEVLPIRFDHLRLLQALPHLHKDPFDRILIAQSRAEGIPLITVDSDICWYDVQILG